MAVMKRIVVGWLNGDEANDIVEYALLTVFVALVAAFAFNVLQDAIADGYVNRDTAEQDLWEPENPE